MNPAEAPKPWAPVYDEKDLVETIRRASRLPAKQFYVTSYTDPEPCQGDVLELDSAVPVIDPDGDVAAGAPAVHWMVVASSCDVSRTGDSNVEYVPIVPLIPFSALGLAGDAELHARSYKVSRVFLVPSWDAGVVGHAADFSRFVSLHRDALRERVKVKARMCREAWILLNACLVRLLAREDGRHVPT